MKNLIILAAAGFIFGGVLTAVIFKATNLNFNPAKTEPSITENQDSTSVTTSNISVSIDGQEI